MVSFILYNQFYFNFHQYNLISIFSDSCLWEDSRKPRNEAVKAGLAAFQNFKTVVVLTQIVRQEGADQAAFRECLQHFRDGNLTQADYDFLHPRTTGTVSRDDEKRFENSLYLMYTREEVREYNMQQLDRLNRQGHRTARIDAIHSNKAAEGMTADNMQGLQPFLMVARGARVMITSNIWTEVGLTNGAMGTVRYIVYKEGILPPSMPRAIIVEMDDGYRGPSLPGLPNHVVINQKIVYSHSKNANETVETLERTQFPLMLAFAVTIHKSQGKHLTDIIN